MLHLSHTRTHECARIARVRNAIQKAKLNVVHGLFQGRSNTDSQHHASNLFPKNKHKSLLSHTFHHEIAHFDW